MKACEVLDKLEITRRTLSTYVKEKKIRVKELGNGFYDYNSEDVDVLIGQKNFRDRVVIYANHEKHEFNMSKEKIQSVLKYITKIIIRNN